MFLQVSHTSTERERERERESFLERAFFEAIVSTRPVAPFRQAIHPLAWREDALKKVSLRSLRGLKRLTYLVPEMLVRRQTVPTSRSSPVCHPASPLHFAGRSENASRKGRHLVQPNREVIVVCRKKLPFRDVFTTNGRMLAGESCMETQFSDQTAQATHLGIQAVPFNMCFFGAWVLSYMRCRELVVASHLYMRAVRACVSVFVCAVCLCVSAVGVSVTKGIHGVASSRPRSLQQSLAKTLRRM